MKQFSIRAEESAQRCYLYKCHKQTTSRIKHKCHIIHAYQTSNSRTYIIYCVIILLHRKKYKLQLHV